MEEVCGNFQEFEIMLNIAEKQSRIEKSTHQSRERGTTGVRRRREARPIGPSLQTMNQAYGEPQQVPHTSQAHSSIGQSICLINKGFRVRVPVGLPLKTIGETMKKSSFNSSNKTKKKKKTWQGQGSNSKFGSPGPHGGNKRYRKKHRGQGKKR